MSRPAARGGDQALLRRALLLCVRSPESAQAESALAGLVAAGLDLARLVDIAVWHRVEGYLWLAMRDAGSLVARSEQAADSMKRLERSYLASAARHLTVLADLQAIAGVFDTAGISFAVLKGPALAELAYLRPDLRSYQDLDLLVSPARLGEALAQVESIGGQIFDANWDLMAALEVGEVRVRLTSGTVLDLHWSLFNDTPLRRTFPVETDVLLGRTVIVRLGNRSVPVLEPTDALVHVAVHACMAGGNKLGWLKDVEQSIANRFDGWSKAIDRSREWNAGLPVATVLLRTNRVLASQVADDVLRALASPTWLAIVRLTDRLRPIPGSTREASLSRLVARSARGGLRFSVVELLRRSCAHLGSVVHLAKPKPLWDASNRASAAFPSGERATFLTRITSSSSRGGESRARR